MSKLVELIIEFQRKVVEETGVNDIVKIVLKDRTFNDIVREYSYINNYSTKYVDFCKEVTIANLYGLELVKESDVEKQKLELENYAKIKKIVG
jgi:hypothetical protein